MWHQFMYLSHPPVAFVVVGSFFPPDGAHLIPIHKERLVVQNITGARPPLPGRAVLGYPFDY